MSVMLYHAGFTQFSGGFTGVDIFFVISGYLITDVIASAIDKGEFNILTFYEHRIRRILPTLLLVMSICFVVAWFLMLPQDMKIFSQSLISSSAFVSNIFLWRTSGYFDVAGETKPLLHTWSLAIEEQFYMFYPILLASLWGFGKKKTYSILLFLTLISFLSTVLLSEIKPIATFYLLPTRCWELLIGSLIAETFICDFRRRLNKTILNFGGLGGIILLAFGIYSFDKNTSYPGVNTLFPTLGTALILLFATKNTICGKILSSKFLVTIGLFSYSAYLVHQPILAFARYYSMEQLSPSVLSVLLVASLFLAHISWMYVENPFRDKRFVDSRTIFISFAIGSLFLCCIGLAGHLTEGFSTRSDFLKYKVLNYDISKTGYLPCTEELTNDGINLNYCLRSSQKKIQAALIGDSHAQDKYYGIENNDFERGWLLIGNSSCPPLLGINVVSTQFNCREKFDKIVKYILNNTNISTVVISYYGQYHYDFAYAADEISSKTGPEIIKLTDDHGTDSSKTELFYIGFSKMIKTFIDAGKSVYLVIDIPELPYFPRNCISGRSNCLVPKEKVLERQADHRMMIERIKTSFPQVSVYDPINVFCDQESCSYKNDNVVLYRDSHHLSIDGSNYYGKEFLNWMNSPTAVRRKINQAFKGK